MMKSRAIYLTLLLCVLCFFGCTGKKTKPAEQNAAVDSLHIEDNYSSSKKHEFNFDLVDYLLINVDRAYELVYELGMSTLVTGETEEVQGSGVCRFVFLGTNREDQFVREILYAISQDGMIYEYDPIFDIWNCVFSP